MSGAYEEELRKGLGPGRPHKVLARTGSTNEVALAWATEGAGSAPDGALVIADEQTEGRGRWGRSWASTPGKALMFSLILRPQGLAPQRLGLLTAAMGVACAEAIGDLGPLAPTIKWPNDVDIRARKVAGILFETQLLGSEAGVAVAGVGVNTHWALEEIPPEIRDRATSLAIELEEAPGRGEVLAAILARFEPLYRGVVGGTGVGALLRRADELSELKGEPVEVTWTDGRVARGVAGSVTAAGALEVEIDGAVQEVDVAEVTRVRRNAAE